MTERELLLGSSFHLSSAGDPSSGPAFAAWGRVATGGFEADVDDVRMDGDVTTGLFGLDAEWDRVLAGLLLSQSNDEGSYTLSPTLGSDRVTVESTMTGVYAAQPPRSRIFRSPRRWPNRRRRLHTIGRPWRGRRGPESQSVDPMWRPPAAQAQADAMMMCPRLVAPLYRAACSGRPPRGFAVDTRR